MECCRPFSSLQVSFQHTALVHTFELSSVTIFSFAAGTFMDQISPKCSFLLEVHLEEQKKRVLAMFILFIKSVGLDDKVTHFLQYFLLFLFF